jgi:hypothetical protein
VFLLSAPAWAVSPLGTASRFGFVSSGTDTSHYLGAFQDLGLTWDRPHPGPFSWDKVEPTEGSYDFSAPDALVKYAQSLGAPILATIWPFAEWDQEYWMSQPDWEASHGFQQELPISRYKPHDMDAYKAFVKALVERYDGDGIDDMPGLTMPIKHWEVLNEPETSDWSDLNFFKGDASDYLEVLQATWEAIKEADPEAVVLNGGCTGQTPFTFWQEVMSLGGGAYFDVGNTHSITPTLEEEDLNTGAWDELMDAYGISSFWVTEVQIASGTTSGQEMSEDDQARLICKGYVRAFANGAQKIFYTIYQVDENSEEKFKNAALVDPDGRKRPAWYALYTLIQKLDGFSQVETLAYGQYKFTVNGRTVYVLWGSGSVPSEISGQVRVTTYTGEEYEAQASQLSLSNDPIFVEPL